MISFLRDLVFQDFWLKLFSFVLAILTWFTVNRMANQKESLSVGSLSLAPPEQRTLTRLPVLIVSSAEDVRSFRVSPKETDVTVQGSGTLLKELQNRDVRASVDLTGIEAGKDLRIRIDVSTPPGISYVRVEPQEVQVIYPAKDDRTN
jgi:YbbR domain-containing protein